MIYIMNLLPNLRILPESIIKLPSKIYIFGVIFQLCYYGRELFQK